jgi:cellulose synthase/poly-beta-1,6-N-acetylglucosamine synthase-like glycosyltransferase
MTIVDSILLALTAVASIPIAVLACEVFMAFWPWRPRPHRPQPRSRCAILVPAHNEASGIPATVVNLRSQMRESDRLIVIADNCSDSTATAAREAGAEVVERADSERRGKGFALEFGLKHLESDPPDIVVLVDADTRAAAGSLDWLVHDAQWRQAPIQGVFTDVPTPASPGPREQWSAFALTFKNLVRPLGLYRLGMPCLLCGSGMAFPWGVIRKADLGTGNIVEDMKLGIDLALAGHPARFCPEARFVSDDAPTLDAAAKRRTRWEHGHVATILTQAPRLLAGALRSGKVSLVALALELAVPPLSLLFFIQAFLGAACLLSWQLGGSALPALIWASGGGIAVVTILTAWAIFGRRLISPKFLCLLPVYVLWKAPIYLKLMVAPQRNWVRTERKRAS